MAVAPSTQAVLDAIRVALPGARILTDATDVEAFRWDETEYMHPGQPLAVVFPRDPLVTVWGSLATILWAQRCRAAGVTVSWRRLGVTGLLCAVVVVTGSTLALAVTA